MKPEVVIECSSPYGEWQKGDVGIVDGYCRGGDDVPCAVVIVREKFAMVPIYGIRFLHWIKER